MTKIKSITVTSPMTYLWLKYVTGVDLSQHCAKGLIGAYSKHIKADLKEATDILLNEAESKVFSRPARPASQANPSEVSSGLGADCLSRNLPMRSEQAIQMGEELSSRIQAQRR